MTTLPAVVRIGKAGILLFLLGLMAGGAIVNIADLFIPLKGKGIPGWLWPILILIWTPGLVGLLLSFYSIARYPYLSLITGGGPILVNTQSWIWRLLGGLFYMLSPIFMWATWNGDVAWHERIWFTALAIDFGFAGFLMATYRREKHVTIATFLELTYYAGVLLFPLYLPSIAIGSVRCRQYLKKLNAGNSDASARATDFPGWTT